MKPFFFQDHEGRELTASLLGEPGSRWINFICVHPGPIPYGTVTLKELLTTDDEYPAWNGVLFPFGDLHASRDYELVMLTIERVEQIAEWAQAEALGRLESECE